MIEPDVQTVSVSDANMALSWESIGRLVRAETLHVVSAHFAARAISERDSISQSQVSRAAVADGSNGTGGDVR